MVAIPVRPLFVVTLLVAAVSAAGDEPYLVRDINTEGGQERGSNPVLLTAADDYALLLMADDDHGFEPWTSDGTAAGTRLLRDLCPGGCSSSQARIFPSLGGRLVFSTSPDFGRGPLLASDGTWQGTVDLGVGLVDWFTPIGLIEDRDLFLFAASRHFQDTETELWVTDGTPQGTRALDSGPDGPPLLSFGYTVAEGSVLFTGYRPETGFELWRSDGTGAGTARVADLDPGPAASFPTEFWRLPAGTVFFTSPSSDPCPVILWRSDGTEQGTVRLAEYERCGARPRTPETLGAAGSVYFAFRFFQPPIELWRSDGTAAGTRLLTSFARHALAAGVAVGDSVFFAADDGARGRELWVADADGARMVVDLCDDECSSNPEDLAWIDGTLYFRADDGFRGLELWRSDGTAAGTQLVVDACPGSCGSFPRTVGTIGDRVFFFTDRPDRMNDLWVIEGQSAQRLIDLPTGLFGPTAAVGDLMLFSRFDPQYGPELWRTDGTAEGTELVVDVVTGRHPGAGSSPELVTPWGDRVLLFAAGPDDGYQPWASDGTAEGTRRLGIALEPEDQPANHPAYSSPVTRGSKAFFLAQRAAGERVELWVSSPTGPPQRLLDVPGPFGSHLVGFSTGVALFVDGSFETPGGLWVSDGTQAGTKLLAVFTEVGGGGEEGGSPTGELDGNLYFGASADPDDPDLELWKTDGTAAGTMQVADLDPGEGSTAPGGFVRLGGTLLFAATTDGRRVLWRTDGTAAGTRPVAESSEGGAGFDPRVLTRIGGRIFYFANGFLVGNAVWTSDGTEAGTAAVAPVPGPFSTSPLPKEAATGSRIFFIVENDDFEPELWVSDGTAAGTGSIQHLLPDSGRALGLWSAGDQVRVSIDGPALELWETDGSFAGTRRLVSLLHGASNERIEDLAQVGPLLFFNGPHPEAGSELLALRTGPPEPCAADATTLCLRGGRFAVRARWRDPRSGDEGTAGAMPLAGSDRTGLFWFFQPDNVELVFKTLDGGGANGFFWNFYGALSDVEYWIEVTDTNTGRRVEYRNLEGEICGRGDTTAFPARPRLPVPAPARAPVHSAVANGADGTACGGDPGDLCLLGDRFRVEVEWADQRSGDSGTGTAIPFADRSGFFWFFEPQNVELVVKILDGRPVNGRFWVFYGGLSDVAYTITVTDTETGDETVYHNPPGEICGRGDTTAF